VIVEYLDEVFDTGNSLSPKNSIDRANMRAWMRFIDEVPSMAVRVPSFQLVLKKRFEAMSDEEYNIFVQKNPVRSDFFRRLRKNGFSDEDYNEALERLKRSIIRMNHALSDSNWICGDHYSLADICLIPIFQRLIDLKLFALWEGYPLVGSWFERAQDRQSFDIAFYPGAKFLVENIT
jgi:glutathione S-transferase